MAAQREFALSFHNGLLCGVCGGIAESLGWRPSVVRVLYLLATMASGIAPGVVAYLVLYLSMPSPQAPRAARRDALA